MSNVSNKKKTAFLGMSHGTAQNRLRKMILFKLVREAGLSLCFRCKEQIETIENFSIEHKTPWLGVDVELFWDLDNIAFSHLSCNCGARRIPSDKVGPDGTKWCNFCETFKNVGEFRKRTSSKGAEIPAQYCRSCAKKKHTEYRHRTGLRGMT